MCKIILVIATWIGLTYGYSRFRAEIPNGYNVKHPCPGRGVWEAVGHMAPHYTSRKNIFGQEVLKMVRSGPFDWSKICPLDSDGDGLTNGQELGDPNCMWKPNEPGSSLGPVLGHPGFCEPDRPKCDSTFTHSDCPNPYAPNRGASAKVLPVGANDHPQSFIAKNGGRAPPSIGPVGNPVGRSFGGSMQGNTWPPQSRSMSGGSFGMSSGPSRSMIGNSIFGPSPSGMSQFGRSSGVGVDMQPGMGGGMGPGMGAGIGSGMSSAATSGMGGMGGGGMGGMGGGSFFSDPTRDTSSWQAPPSPVMQSRFSQSFGPTPSSPGFGRFDTPSVGMTSGFGGGMGTSGMTPTAGSGPGMFGPPGPPPFWMGSSFRQF